MATTTDTDLLKSLLAKGPPKSLGSSRELTLALGDLYIASTTLKAKPLLVWETESGYPRYYIPFDSLHQDIKAAFATGFSEGGPDVKLEVVNNVKGENDAEAVIERLSIGSKSTTWVRFTGGPLKDLIRFERQEIDEWFENGALFVGIKNPYKRIDTKPVARHVIVKIDGEVVAETTVAVLLSETGLKEAYYLPATSIKSWDMVEKSSWRTACPYKGEAWYLNITVDGKKKEDSIWYYPYPTHESAGIEGFISFYNKEGTDIIVDGVKV
ncbi:uncharacterized protein LTR77_003623 [Saxophila tyrrhenica]|uniref:DUF427 domain-containing protein n=1 Tax=Saxophila tyrrhenica TaxID=1690608 RepID=A0AAV9PH14_9PEZI|nr:hypothetical protein LTR77_003623 [Saxophila tyrrhenica]